MTTQKGSSFSRGMKRTALSVALGMCVAGGVQAQSISGTVRGTVPAGTTVVISNNSGFSRTVTADANGRYNVSSLPVGDYTVEASGIGKRSVTVTTGAAADVSFGSGNATDLGTVTVRGASAPAIDVTSVSTTTIVTSEQLRRLPLTQNAQAIALLAPGANAGAGGYFGGLTSFGGAGVSENASYINGYFSGDPLSNLQAFELPYGAIAQQETYTGGYSAKYGRSDGGVISQVGKSGTNDVHFGGQVTYAPKSLRADSRDTYFPNLDFSQANSNPNIPNQAVLDGNGQPVLDANGEIVRTNEPYQYGYEIPGLAGQLYRARSKSETWNERYSGYVGGPLIKDRLFAFVAAEAYNTHSYNPDTNPDYDGVGRSTHSKTTDPKIYAKLDWNINDSNLLSYTYLGEKYESQGYYTAYDWDAQSDGAILTTVPTPTKMNSEYSILNYTGYLTDNLTLNATYGHMRLANRQINPSILPGVPYIAPANRNPAYGSATAQTSGGYQSKDATDETNGLRMDLEWVIGDHTLTGGIDNIKFEARNEGTGQVADYYSYGQTQGNISTALGVGNPVNAANPQGYYTRELRYFNNTNMSLTQDAWYLEDRWQVTDNFLLSLGVRNDKFENKNGAGEVYMDAKNQWAPRIGASWDVFGDSSLKVFGNAGRYFLALPNNVAIRGASASTYTSQYYTYTGIDEYGAPTGLTPVPSTSGTPSGPVSSNLELGLPVDVQAFAPSDLKNLYQDEYILGFEKTLGESWSYGAKLTYRDLKSSVDDFCDPDALAEAAGLEVQGVDYSVGKVVATAADGQAYNLSACYMFNPGGSNTYSFENRDPNGARLEQKVSASELGFEQGVKRTYKAVDLFLEHPFDGKWEARIDYTYSKLEGNNEGQVKSEFGQSNISKTQDWDAAAMMRFADGYLSNDRRHQIKIRGSYALSDEWLVSGNVRILSGMPVSCLGLYNPDGSIDEATDGEADPIGYGPSYHTCLGEVAKPGEVRTPWQHRVDLGIQYRPNYFDGRLTLGVQVMNVLNSQKATQFDVTSESDAYVVSNTYLMPISYETPRYVMFSAALDF